MKNTFLGLLAVVFVVALTALVPQAQTPTPPARGQAAGRGRGGGGGGGGGGDPWPGKKKVLALADMQSGFHHDSVSHALATIEQIGRQSGTYVTIIATDSQLVTKGQITGKDRYEGRGVN